MIKTTANAPRHHSHIAHRSEPLAFAAKRAYNRLHGWETHIGLDLFRLRGSTLDKNSERDALVRLPIATRKRLIKAAIDGHPVSAIKEWLKIKDDGFLILRFRAKTRRGLRSMLLREAARLDRLDHLERARHVQG